MNYLIIFTKGYKMDRIQKFTYKIKEMLLEIGFCKIVVSNQYRSVTNYVYGSIYCIPQYIDNLGFLIEYAYSYREAKNHGHEDGDAFPLDMGEEAILIGLKSELDRIIKCNKDSCV
jgi:hypothetical protein